MSKKKEGEQKFLSEVDKLILKLDEIIISINGKQGAIDYKSVKDSFDKLRFQISEQLKEIETLLAERDKVLNSTVPKEIYERKKLETSLETKLDAVESKMKELNLELKAQKNKIGKYGDFTQKEQMVSLIEQKFQLLRGKLDGMEIEEKQIEENKTSIEQLEDILAKEDGGQPERELYEEEKQAMDEWKEEVKRQDEDIEEIGNIVNDIREQARLASENIDRTNKTVKKLTKSTEQARKNVSSQNTKLKNLVSKLRSGDKICVDIVLILVGLGLVGALYYLIKSRLD